MRLNPYWRIDGDHTSRVIDLLNTAAPFTKHGNNYRTLARLVAGAYRNGKRHGREQEKLVRVNRTHRSSAA
jgi:hypothetical protein